MESCPGNGEFLLKLADCFAIGGNEGSVKWWDAVDVIGIDAYYTIAPGVRARAVHDNLTTRNESERLLVISGPQGGNTYGTAGEGLLGADCVVTCR